MNGRRILAGAGLGAAALAGAALAAQRVLVGRDRRRPDPDAALAFSLPPGEGRRFPGHDGGTIATLALGEGPPILLSHGVTLSMRTWVKQLEALPREGFRAIAFDHRGHGDSECGTTGHSLENLAVDVRTVLDTLDVRDAVLVGHSMGGVAVQAYVTRYPEHAAARVRGLVLLSTLCRVRISHMRRMRRLIERLADNTPDLASLMRRPDLGFLLARIGFGRDPQPSHVELTRRMIVACAPETSHGATRALLGLDLTRDLPRIRIPCLVACGTSDVITPPAESRLIASLIPGARLELFDGGGHMLMLERAAELDALLVDFAREVRLASLPSVPKRATG